MQTTQAKLDVLKRYFLWFFLYSVIGWCYEVFLEVVVYRWGFTNRGVLLGPYCPVYGFGALAFLVTLDPLIRGKSWKRRLALLPAIVLGCALVATAIELAASYLCQALLGAWPWQTYARDYAVHFQGRIALSPSIRFGLGGALFLYLLQPLFERLTDALGPRGRTAAFALCGGVMGVDCMAFLLGNLL